VLPTGVTPTTGNRTLGLTGPNTGANTLSAAIGDAGSGSVTSVSKSGAGKWVLNGANTYTGTTTVASGTLELGASAQSPVLTNAGGANVQGRLVLDYSGSSPVTSINT